MAGRGMGSSTVLLCLGIVAIHYLSTFILISGCGNLDTELMVGYEEGPQLDTSSCTNRPPRLELIVPTSRDQLAIAARIFAG